MRCFGMALAASLLAAPAFAADAAHPAVVELYQSQGCSSCPPANANINALADRADVLALSFSVTYWDQLGWKDTFARPWYTGRQWDYAYAAKRSEVATPQVIVNGRGTVVGGNRAELDAAIGKYDRGSAGPAISASGATLTVGAAAPPASATVWLVRYDPRVQNVAVRAGENGGRTLPHRNIVREIVSLGGWNGQAASFRLPAAEDAAYRSAVLVQAGKGGPIIAASRL